MDEVLQLLSLKHAENTIVGSDVARGLSGGEKARTAHLLPCISLRL